MKRYWMVAVSLGILGGTAILLVFLFFARKDQAVLSLDSHGQIGTKSPIEIQFHFDVNAANVSAHITVFPEIHGRLDVQGNTLRLFPDEPLSPNAEYTVTLRKGPLGMNREFLYQDYSWTFTVREPAVVFLRPPDENAEIWVYHPANQEERQLTQTGGGVFDYSVSPNGEYVIYSINNSKGGRDLWLVNREGQQQREIVSCGEDICDKADWSPDMSQIAYTRQRKPENQISDTSSEIWLINWQDLTTTALQPGRQGSSPIWSPNGRYLAFHDSLVNQVIILDFQTRTEMSFSSNLRETGVWFPDSKSFITGFSYNDLPYPNDIFYSIEFENEQIVPILNSDVDFRDFSLPEWSPDGEWLVTGFSCPDCSPTQQLSMMRLNGEQSVAITTDLQYSNGSYHWNPDGSKLVFQRFYTGSSLSKPEVWIWERSSGLLSKILENASLPNWMP